MLAITGNGNKLTCGIAHDAVCSPHFSFTRRSKRSPRSVPAALGPSTTGADASTEALRPLDSITPLNPDALRRIPLSTPPRTPPPALTSLSVNDAELAFPLILVTGENDAQSLCAFHRLPKLKKV